MRWFQKAAEQGSADAQLNLGLFYGKGIGVELDYVKAVSWYRIAAEQGFAAAQCSLANCHYNGRGVAQDYAEALVWYEKGCRTRPSRRRVLPRRVL